MEGLAARGDDTVAATRWGRHGRLAASLAAEVQGPPPAGTRDTRSRAFCRAPTTRAGASGQLITKFKKVKPGKRSPGGPAESDPILTSPHLTSY